MEKTTMCKHMSHQLVGLKQTGANSPQAAPLLAMLTETIAEKKKACFTDRINKMNIYLFTNNRNEYGN